MVELEEQLRNVTLRKSRVRPYENATFAVRYFTYEEAAPMSLFVTTEQMDRHRRIGANLLAQGQPTQLNMVRGLILEGGPKGRQGLIPPIVETFEPEDITYVIDGSHRTNGGRWAGIEGFVAVHITGIRPDCPPYAFPNTWEEVRELPEKPDDPSIMKNYREPDHPYRLYRDFEPINGSTPRVEGQ